MANGLMDALNEAIALDTAYEMLKNLPSGAVVVLDYYDAPEILRGYSENGGDEDYILVHNTPDVHWSYKLAVCNEDTYYLGNSSGKFYYITITAHA